MVRIAAEVALLANRREELQLIKEMQEGLAIGKAVERLRVSS